MPVSMITPAYGARARTARPQRQPARHRLPKSSATRRVLIAARVLMAMGAALIMIVTGLAWTGNHNIFAGITTSQALDGIPGSTGGDQNILIMGLDSRLDEKGRPLPQDIYDALHAGDETAGGYNANVLILVHIPAGVGPITAISIPRDDYVKLSGCPTSSCEGKVKQAYGFAYQRMMDSFEATGSSSSTSSSRGPSHSGDPAAHEQTAREAGRRAQINTVRNLLQVPIDHFIEVTLVAFFEIARVVEPITVCLNEDTYDSFSGADFHKGVQQIDASQAMAFVRQRRDINDELMFTDLDRTRRQQAFIVSLLTALRNGGSLSSPSKLRQLLDVARQNIAVDAGFDLPGFVQHASALTDRPVSLYTLPITSFTTDAAGEDINTVDVPTVRAIVHNLIGSDAQANESSTTGVRTTADNAPLGNASLSGVSGTVLDVVNASSIDGLATQLVTTWEAKGFTPGEATRAEYTRQQSTVEYGPGAEAAATALAQELNLTPMQSSAVPPGTVRLTAGTDYPGGGYIHSSTTSTPSTSTSTTPVATVSATATGTQTPAPTDLTRMTGDNPPCVK